MLDHLYRPVPLTLVAGGGCEAVIWNKGRFEQAVQRLLAAALRQVPLINGLQIVQIQLNDLGQVYEIGPGVFNGKCSRPLGYFLGNGVGVRVRRGDLVHRTPFSRVVKVKVQVHIFPKCLLEIQVNLTGCAVHIHIHV